MQIDAPTPEPHSVASTDDTSASEPFDSSAGESPAAAGSGQAAEPAVTFERATTSLFDQLNDPLSSPASQMPSSTAVTSGRFTPLQTAWELGFAKPQLDFLGQIPTALPPTAGAPVDTGHVAPTDAKSFFDGLSQEQQVGFTDRHPEIVGALDGAPYELRYQANKVLIQDHLDEVLPHFNDQLRQANTWIERFSSRAHLEPQQQQILDGQSRLSKRLGDKIEVRQSWTDPDRDFLLFDPSGDGRIAEVKGNLDLADHVAIIVPGITNDLNNYQGVKNNGGLEQFAANLQSKAAELSHQLGRPEQEVASISWLGYDTPDRLIPDATSKSAARVAAVALPRFVAGLELTLPHDPHLTVIGHSYGSLVTGMSGGQGLDAESIVFVGSPGVGAPTAAELGFAASTEIYAAKAKADIIGLTPGWVLGPDPSNAGFGAMSFDTGAAKGHGQYFTDQSLHNLASIQLNID